MGDIYENVYNLTISSNKLLYSYLSSNKLFELSVDSNTSFSKLNAYEYNFLNSNLGFSSNNNTIIYRATSNYFKGDVYIDGIINAREFSSKVLLLDEHNKIPLSYIPNINTGIIYNSNSIGIGITTPETKLHISSGDAYIQNGRLGIGTKASYNFQLDKNDNQIGIPAFVISSNNRHIFDIYTERGTVVINDTNNSIIIDSNIKLNVNGLTKTQSLLISDFFISSNQKTIINNQLAISNLTSINNNSILIDSNTDIIINNLSLKKYLSNVDDISKKIPFSNNIIITENSSNNQIIINNSNIKINNLITSNINLINYDSLTSNPYDESVFDIKGKIRLYNDTSNIISNIYMNDNNVYIITNDKLITYNLNLKNYSTLNLNLNGLLVKTKDINFAYYQYPNIYLNNNLIITIYSEIITDFAITDNNCPFIYLINNYGNFIIYYLNISNGNYEPIANYSIPNEKIIKIDSFKNNNIYNKLAVILTNLNKLYIYTGIPDTLFIPISFIPQIGLNDTILDFSCGDIHTIIVTTLNVYSFGLNNDNNNYYRGYSTIGLTTTNTQASIIQTLNNKSIIKVKAFKNSSIVIDKDGYVYIFGFINRLFSNELTRIFKIDTLSKIKDFCCNNNDVYLLSYFNDIFVINELTNNNSKILILPDYFYGTSIKSRGSIVIGGNNFYSNQNNQNLYLPRNSLLVENFVGVGTNIKGDSKYSLIVSGNINIQNGSIFSNGEPFISASSSGTSTGIINNLNNYWYKTGNNISYNDGYVGIGTLNPKTHFHIYGNSIIEGNLTINGKILTNQYSPLVINREKEVYYNGIIGINKTIPTSTFDLYDGDFKITNVLPISGLITIDQQTLDIYNLTANTFYTNSIITNATGDLIMSMYFNNDESLNNTINIKKYINNEWVTINPILNIPNNNYNNVDQSFAISENSSNLFIGALYNKILIGSSFVYIGGIYKYTININNQIQQQELITARIPNALNEVYYRIGGNICCSSDGNILISTIYDYGNLLYINKNNIVTILNFNYYNKFHYSFNKQVTSETIFKPKVIYIDTNTSGSLIIINFIYDTSTLVNITDFNFFNFYIIRDNEIYFLKYPDGYQSNSYVTSLSITARGNRLFITTKNDIHFIYDADFMNLNYQTTSISDVTIKYFNISPSYVINLKDDGDYLTIKNYRGKISKLGTNIYIGNNRRILNYKLNINNNQWNVRELVSDINTQINIYNYKFDIDYNGYNLIVSYLYKISESAEKDTIQIVNTIINVYKEQTSLYLYNSNLNINVDTNITSNLYANKIYGDGSNISNIQLTNIVFKNVNNELTFINNNGRLINSANLTWNSNNNFLNIIGSINLTSNIETYNGDIKSGVNIIVGSNLYINSNVYAYSNIYVSSDINVKSNLIVQSNIYGNTDIYINRDLFTRNTINSISGNINSGLNINSKLNITAGSNLNVTSNLIVGFNSTIGSNLTVNSNIIVGLNVNVGSNVTINCNLNVGSNLTVNNSIRTLIGSINSANNITANNNINTINGSVISGLDIIANSSIRTINGSIVSGLDLFTSNSIKTIYGSIESGVNIIANSNIIGYSNLTITSNISILQGGLISQSNLQSLNGSLISGLDIIGNSNLIINSNIRTINGSIYSGSNIYANFFYGNGFNISNIHPSNIIDFGEVKYGGTGLKNLSSNGLLIGNGSNKIIVTSNLFWDNNKQLLIFNNASLLLSNIAPIIDVKFLSNMHFSEVLNISNGGTGNNNFNSNSIIFCSFDKLVSSSNFYWLNESNSLYVNGRIFGDGSNILNIDPYNIYNNVPVFKGGTGKSFLDYGTILIGNGYNDLYTTSNINWDSNTNTLNISNINIFNDLIINGSNVSNIFQKKYTSIFSIKDGGIGVSNINTNEFIFGFDENKIATTSNVKWNNITNTMEIATNLNVSNLFASNLYGDGFNINNFDANKISGVLQLSNGGLGFSTISKNSLIYASADNKLAELNRLRWNASLNTFFVEGNIDIMNYNYNGNAFNLNNINASKITGIIPLVNGGNGNNEFLDGGIVFGKIQNPENLGDKNNKLITSSGLNWNNNTNYLKIINNNDNKTGGININDKTIIDLDGNIMINQNGDVDDKELRVFGTTNTYKLVICENQYYDNNNETQANLLTTTTSGIGIGINNPTSLFHVNGPIKCNSLQVGETFISSTGSFSGAIDNISTVTGGTLAVQFGGTGIDTFPKDEQIFFGSPNLFKQSSNLIWKNSTNRLGIGTTIPLKSLDVRGGINYNGGFTSNNDSIASIEGINYGSNNNKNILCTNKNFYIGYSNIDNYKLKVDGNVYVAGYVTSLSDIRYKTNITDINNPLDKIQQLKGVYYNMIDDEKRSIGLIAQEVETIIPEVVYTNKDNTKSIAYANMVGLIVESIKELTERIKKLEEKL